MRFLFKKWFFFIEGSLVIIAGVGVLSAALFPAITGYLERSRDTARMAHLNSIATALWAYYSDNAKYPEPKNGCLGLTESQVSSYFLRGIPRDPTPGRTSGNCDGTGGMSYGYGTFTLSGWIQGYYLIADMENYSGWNSYMIPPPDADETFFQSLSYGSGPYYILHNAPYDSFDSQDM